MYPCDHIMKNMELKFLFFSSETKKKLFLLTVYISTTFSHEMHRRLRRDSWDLILVCMMVETVHGQCREDPWIQQDKLQGQDLTAWMAVGV